MRRRAAFWSGQTSFDEQIDHCYPSRQAHLGNGVSGTPASSPARTRCAWTRSAPPQQRHGGAAPRACVSSSSPCVNFVASKANTSLAMTQFGALQSTQRRDLLQRQERVVLEKALHIPIIDVDPELVKLIWGGQLSVSQMAQPRFLPIFLPTRRGGGAEKSCKGFAIGDAAMRSTPGDTVAPLIVPSYLEHAAIALEEHQKS